MPPSGYFCLVLHAHLPFVRHPEYEDCLEERWFFETMTESYLPLLRVMEGWRRDGIDFRLTMSLTATLVAMMNDPLLRGRYARYLDGRIELAEKEIVRTEGTPEFNATARMYLRRFLACRELYEKRRRDIASAFRAFFESGNLELCACSATHAYLPLLGVNSAAVRAQVRWGVQQHRENFGSPPEGMWNAECAYYPGLEEILKSSRVSYFFAESHGVLYADRRPRDGVFAPIACKNGVAVFGRDTVTARAVWNADEGYPGDFRYREYYRDAGFDLGADYVARYIHESGLRVATGIKYNKITGPGVTLEKKEPYSETEAGGAISQHAENFLLNRRLQVRHLSRLMSHPPILVSPYDAELFGHWWFEGPLWLDKVMRGFCDPASAIKPITPSEYLRLHIPLQTATPCQSSWGDRGYAGVWLDKSNDWIYPHLHVAADRMSKLAGKFKGTGDPILRRVLNQMARELMLAQSSDWAFIMKTKTMADYAIRRTKSHLLAVSDLFDQINRDAIDAASLIDLESRNNVFPNLQFEIHAD